MKFGGSVNPLSEQTKNMLDGKAWLAACIGLFMAFQAADPAAAATERRLAFHMLHTKEKIDIVYKRNGEFVPSAIKKLNWFMRDRRRDAPTKMDPNVYDLVWELRSELGSKVPAHVISGYRSLKTNNMLRRIGRRVARRSQHTAGRAIDLVFPDVPLVKLRNNALVKKRGGVGYYPRSGTMGFVHVDTGRVRHWPRMSSRKLASIFRQHKGKGKAKALLRNAVARKITRPTTKPKIAASASVQIASLSAGAQSALTNKIAGVTAPKPLVKPKAVIAAYRTAQLQAAAKREQERLELLNSQDLQIQPASTHPQFANFATKSNSQLGLQAGWLEDKPLVITPTRASITTASVAPREEERGIWGMAKSFNFFPLSLFRRDGQPQRFQVGAPNPGRPATGDADVDGGTFAGVAPAAVEPLAPAKWETVPLRKRLSPEQLARVASQIVNRNGKTGLIRTRAVEMIRPLRRIGSQDATARLLLEKAAEAQPLSFE